MSSLYARLAAVSEPWGSKAPDSPWRRFAQLAAADASASGGGSGGGRSRVPYAPKREYIMETCTWSMVVVVVIVVLNSSGSSSSRRKFRSQTSDNMER